MSAKLNTPMGEHRDALIEESIEHIICALGDPVQDATLRTLLIDTIRANWVFYFLWYINADHNHIWDEIERAAVLHRLGEESDHDVLRVYLRLAGGT